MTSSTADPEWQAAISVWGTHYAFSYHPETDPDEPYAARPRRQDGQHQVIRAATPSQLRQAIQAHQDQQHAPREATP